MYEQNEKSAKEGMYEEESEIMPGLWDKPLRWQIIYEYCPE